MLSKRLLTGFAALAASVAVSAAPAQASAQTGPISAPADAHSGQIIAVLIGLAVAPRPFTPPLGTDKGSFLDASAIYGSDVYQHNQTDLEF
jgi:hypothetical protein